MSAEGVEGLLVGRLGVLVVDRVVDASVDDGGGVASATMLPTNSSRSGKVTHVIVRMIRI